MKKLLGKLALLFFTIFFLTLLIEIVSLLFRDKFSKFNEESVREIDWISTQGEQFKNEYVLDKDIGFRPKLKTNLYSEYGTKPNEYDVNDKKNKKRILFIGDSVTNRQKIIFALRDKFREDKYEYWVAGVESYNTSQEVKFYEKYNYKIKPEQVILTFHLNDFETTPMIFKDGDKYVAFAPNMPIRKMNPFLFRYSKIYRLIKNVQFANNKNNSADEITQEVESMLKKLNDCLDKDGIKFSIVILPIFKAYEDWSADEKKAREKILEIVQKLNIEHFDLLPILNDSLKEGINVQETKGDSWHPSQDVAFKFGEFLYNENLLIDSE